MFIGINIGALAVKVACLDGDRSGPSRVSWRVVPHQGQPVQALDHILKDFPAGGSYGVCGYLGHLSEAAATEAAIRFVGEDFDAVASLGGETFAVYLLAGGRIFTTLSHNQCAAGSGEFLVQQIGRLGLTLDEAIRRSFDGKIVPLASRCSVHCKSDITHKLNRKEASVEDILRTLHDSMADKVVSLLDKAPRAVRKLLLIGGAAQNAALVAALRDKLPTTEIVVLPESPYFEALGAAVLTRDQPLYDHPNVTVSSSLDTLPPLAKFEDQVVSMTLPPADSSATGPLVLGVDAGSTTTKAVLMDPESGGIVASHYGRTNGDPVEATRQCLRAMASQVGKREIGLMTATGSARELIGAYLGTTYVYNEISAHAAGAARFDAEVDTIFEIGGQDAKYILLRNRVPVDYAMNASCSAGTGSFLEECAQGDLGLPLAEISRAALQAKRPVQFKATCAAFINSDIRTALQEGYSRQDVAAGLVYAVVHNYLSKVKGPRAVGRRVFFQGGLAMNRAVACAMAQCLGKKVVIPPHPELLGAVGVALLAMERCKGLPAPATADLETLASPIMSVVGRFLCGGCENRCTIDRFEVAGSPRRLAGGERRFPFGGRCSRFEGAWKGQARPADGVDLVERRNHILMPASGRSMGVPPMSTTGVSPVVSSSSVFPASEEQQREQQQQQQKQQQRHGQDARETHGQDAHATPHAGGTPATHADKMSAPPRRIGIPRALTAHSLYPLYSTFFRELGMDVVLSGVDAAGAMKANSGFCYPVQIAHGAVLDLLKGGTDLIFLPQVIRMPNPAAGRDSYLCPLAQASPYVTAKAFPGAKMLSPVLDFAHGYEASAAMIDLAQSQLDFDRDTAQRAYRLAAAAQLGAEAAMLALGQQALKDALADGKPAILLVGRSYNAFPPEASQSVARKLASMGVRVIPGDCLPRRQGGQTAWHYPNVILNAVALAKRHENLFLLYVSNFSCTIDAFTHSFFVSEMGAKPYLMLEIDAHTADAGIQTRLEAFWDILRNYRPQHVSASVFRPAVIGRDAVVTTSAGQRIPLDDARVRIRFPSFSHYHSRAVTQGARQLGLNAGASLDLSRAQLERGLQFSSGRECLPLPICIGQMLEAHEARAPGEVVGFYMFAGGAPCVVDCYVEYLRQFIRDNELKDLFIFDPRQGNDFYGLSFRKIGQWVVPLITLADLFVEMEQTLCVAGQDDGPERLRDCWERHVERKASPGMTHRDLAALIDAIAAIPRTDPAGRPRVAVTGDFFLRFNPCFMEGVHEKYARHGIILVPVGLNELILYSIYSDMADVARGWNLPPDSARAIAQACARFFQPEGKDYLANWARYRWVKFHDRHYRELFGRTGLLLGGQHDIARLYEQASRHLSPTIVGEAIPTVGKGVGAEQEGYDGIIAIGPFNCLPFRISEAILKPYGLQKGMPVLTYESDGFSVRPAFLRQVDVHVQQVLANRLARR